MSMFGAIDASASGMTAERLRMDVISNNIANVNTTRTTAGGPYHRRFVVFEPRTGETNSFAQILSSEARGAASAVPLAVYLAHPLRQVGAEVRIRRRSQKLSQNPR